MKLVGGLFINNTNYYVALSDNKTTQRWSIINRYHKDDMLNLALGKPLEHPSFNRLLDLNKASLGEDYILESFCRSKSSGKVQNYGQLTILNKVLAALAKANAYSFPKDAITKNSVENNLGVLRKEFKASDIFVSLSYVMINKNYHTLELKIDDIELYLRSDMMIHVNIDVPLTELEDKKERDKIEVNSIQAVSMDLLRVLIDLSWYEDTETYIKKKKYRSVKTIPEFEEVVMKGILEELRNCKARGEELILSMDTETTGLNEYYLKDENPQKSFIVATPIAWRDNEAVVVFNDMEYFENVPKAYMFSRIKNLVESNPKDIILDYRKLDLDASLLDTTEIIKESKPVDSEKIKRSDINLIGHNVMFDGRVFYDNHVQPYWNNDTLQMAFNLNPKVGKGTIQVLEENHGEEELGEYNIREAKGGVSLKNLTRRLFGHETPELSDILGKGNEDKYKYISDEEVAVIYGCADADYTRLLYKKLRALMPDRMYKQYLMQDIPMLNILYVSEYYGLLMKEDEVKKLADATEKDLNTIKRFLWSYVGRKISYKEKIYQLYVKRQQAIHSEKNFYRMLGEGTITQEEYFNNVSNLYSEVQYLEDRKHVHADRNAEYIFEMKAADIRDVLYTRLEYPIYGYTKGEKKLPSTDKNTMKKLLLKKQPNNELNQDITSDDGKRVLIKAEEFNSYRYPVAYVLQVYSSLNKEFTSYYKPIRDDNMEGRLFKNYSLARIETRRIMNPSQTMKSSLKGLTLPFDGGKDWYMMDFDMAQVEYRIMVSIAGQMEMVERLKDPEKDFHTESASMLSGTPAHKIEKTFRKQMKSVHFGIPYGLGDRSLCEKMFGKVNEVNMIKTRALKSKFEQKNTKVMDMLEGARDNALKPIKADKEFLRYAGFVDYEKDAFTGEITEKFHKVGKVENLLGFYRLFDLENLDDRKIAIIRRAAGNYPIQAFAAELFRIILIRFYNRCVKEGIADKIIWHLLIHDELLTSVHKSINPFYLYKIIMEECMVTIKNHTKYFVGINIGSSWYECKDDASEAPVLFVQRMAKRWDAGEFKNDTWIDNPREYVNKYKDEFVKQRMYEVLVKLQPDIDTAPIDCPFLVDNFENYSVRAFLDDYIPKVYLNKGKPTKQWKNEFTEDERFYYSLHDWALSYFGPNKEIRRFDGTVLKLCEENYNIKETSINLEIDDIDEVELEVDLEQEYLESLYDNWDFNEGNEDMYSDSLFLDDYVDEDDSRIREFEFDFTNSENAKSIADLVVNEKKYENLFMRGDCVIIKLPSSKLYEKVDAFLEPHKQRHGFGVKYKIGNTVMHGDKIDSSFDLRSLDAYISNLIMERKNRANNSSYKYLQLKDNMLIIVCPKRSIIDDIKKFIDKNKDASGLKVNLICNRVVSTLGYINRTLNLKELDSYINSLCELNVRKGISYKYLLRRGNFLILKVNGRKEKAKVKDYLREYVDNSGLQIQFRDRAGIEPWLTVNPNVDLQSIDKFIGEVIESEKVRI